MFNWNPTIKRTKGWSFISIRSGKHLIIKESEFNDAFQDSNGFSEGDRKMIVEMKVGEYIQILDCHICCASVEGE